jgi:hypothetical protein
MVLAVAVEADAQPLRVFVTTAESPATAKPSEADRQQASAAYDAADSARKALEKTLKAQYGSKRDQWPVAEQERLADAEEARDRVNAEWMYRRDAEPVDEDWRVAIARALTQSGRTGRKEHITSVATAAEAQLIVTITGLRNPGAATNAARDRCAAISLSNGPQISDALFASVPTTYRPRRAKVLRLSAPGDGSPFFRFEGCGLHPYFSTEESIANIVNDFAGANRAALMASPGL